MQTLPYLNNVNYKSNNQINYLAGGISIDRPASNNGMSGGIREFIYGMTINEAKNVSVAGSEDKVYFWFPDYNFFLIFDQRLRKWTKELQPDNVTDELKYITIW